MGNLSTCIRESCTLIKWPKISSSTSFSTCHFTFDWCAIWFQAVVVKTPLSWAHFAMCPYHKFCTAHLSTCSFSACLAQRFKIRLFIAPLMTARKIQNGCQIKGLHVDLDNWCKHCSVVPSSCSVRCLWDMIVMHVSWQRGSPDKKE